MTIRSLFDAAVLNYPHAPFMTWKRDKAWHTRTYTEATLRIRQLSEAFHKLKFKPQSTPVALVLENGPEWLESYQALAGAGIVVVPIDPKLHAKEMAHILANSEACGIVASRTLAALLETILPNLPNLKTVIFTDYGYPPPRLHPNVTAHDFTELFLSVRGESLTFFDKNTPNTNDIASIIYTSGTTGKPKGAMLSHGNFYHDAIGSYDGFEKNLFHSDEFLVVLPYFHCFSFMTNFVFPLLKGCHLVFVEALRTVADDFKRHRCSALMAVPLLAEKIYLRIEEKLNKSRMARILVKVGLGHIVGRKIIKNLGGKLRCICTGGAPCPIHIVQGFKKLGIGIIEGYGLTECSPVVAMSHVRTHRPGTIGRPLNNIEIRLANPNENGIGEIQVKGQNVMLGYYNNEEATNNTFTKDGWLKTGDLGTIDKDNNIFIRGRSKDMLLSASGQNIYPEEIEAKLNNLPYVGDSLVVDRNKKLVALVCPDHDIVKQDGISEYDLQKIMNENLVILNRMVASYEKIAEIQLTDEFVKTPKKSIKRYLYK